MGGAYNANVSITVSQSTGPFSHSHCYTVMTNDDWCWMTKKHYVQRLKLCISCCVNYGRTAYSGRT